jgi:hypothetical protein
MIETDLLLNALAQSKGGVQVNTTRTKVTVATRYTPLVKGTAETMLDATRDAVNRLRLRCREVPQFCVYCSDVLSAPEKLQP